MGARFAVVLSFVFLAYSFLLFTFYELQVVNGEYYSARAESREAAGSQKPRRGTIYFTDRVGDLIAVGLDKDFPTVYGVPNDIVDPREVAALIAPILNQEAHSIEEKLSKKDDEYELLEDKGSVTVAQEIDNLKIKGIYIVTEPKRTYPFGSAAAHILGFVGPSDKGTSLVGHYGLEGFYEKVLSATQGEEGENLILTIDPNIQAETERILDNLIGTYKAEGGGAIVEDPRTGKILAMAGWPNFDPNGYQESNIEDFLNPLTQEIYEPGSVVKVLTMSAGIDLGKITPETTYVDGGKLTLSGRTIRNFDFDTRGAYGKITMSNVLEHSVNTGAVFVERLIGRDEFKNYLTAFGIGERTGIDLSSEIRGDLKRLNPKERDIAFATASYGQGIAVTPVGMINAVSVIANGGKLMRPYLNAALSPKVMKTVIKKGTAETVAAMMVSAVDKAKIAKISGYSLAGKTGTAYVPDFVKGGYTEEVINTFVGFGPVGDPKFAILIKLDKPEGAPVAALSVVPAFRDLAQFILNYYNIPPDRL